MGRIEEYKYRLSKPMIINEITFVNMGRENDVLTPASAAYFFVCLKVTKNEIQTN
jgi:hypothetical protein